MAVFQFPILLSSIQNTKLIASIIRWHAITPGFIQVFCLFLANKGNPASPAKYYAQHPQIFRKNFKVIPQVN